MAFVEYAHALVEALAEDYEDGASGYAQTHRRELLDEHKWRAIRYGHDAALLDREMEGTLELGELVDRECERLGIDGIKDVYERDSGAEKQRRLLEEEGPRVDVLLWFLPRQFLDLVCDLWHPRRATDQQHLVDVVFLVASILECLLGRFDGAVDQI